MLENHEALLQLGFAAGLAAWLVKWLTTTVAKSLDHIRAELIKSQLFHTELLRMLAAYDASHRGVDLMSDEEKTEAHEKACIAFGLITERLDALKESIQTNLRNGRV